MTITRFSVKIDSLTIFWLAHVCRNLPAARAYTVIALDRYIEEITESIAHMTAKLDELRYIRNVLITGKKPANCASDNHAIQQEKE